MLEKIQKTTAVKNMFSMWWGVGLHALEMAQKGSEYIFVILKLVAGMALFFILLSVVFQATKDHGKISVKPFAVPEKMQASHKAAGSIIANIIKQELAVMRVQVDNTIRGTSEDGSERKETIISNDKGFFKGENIKLPETGISINDVVEFISGLFGRKNINGSVYTDRDTLYLQVEIDGKIFIEKQTLNEEDRARETALHIPVIKKMAEEISKKILTLTSEEYQLYHSCLDESILIDRYFNEKKYKKLSKLCSQFHGKKSEAERNKLREDVEKLKLSLKETEGIERYIVNILSSKIKESSKEQKVDTAQSKKVTKQTEQIKMAYSLPTAKPLTNTIIPPSSSSVAAVSTASPSDSPVPLVQPEDVELRELANRLEESEIVELIRKCNVVDEFNRSQSNAEEQTAQTAYSKQDFFKAKEAFINSINSNCENPYAWANLGVLLSDLDNKKNGNVLDGVVALQRATEIKDTAGWMWHSLCVAEAYTQKDKFEQAISNNSCVKAREVEPGKRVIYDKLFNIALAEKHIQQKQFKQAFYRYKESIDIDPKRTCRLDSVVEKMKTIQRQSKIKNPESLICQSLSSSYPEEEPDESCEASLVEYKEKCK